MRLFVETITGEKVSVEINGDDDLTTLRKKINQQLHKPKKEDNADKIPTVEGVRTRHLRRHSDVGSRSPSVRRHRRNMSGGVSALGLPQPSPPRSRDVSTRPRSDSRGTPRTPPARSSRSNSEGTNLQKNGNAWEEGKASQKKNTPKYSIKMARTSKKAILRSVLGHQRSEPHRRCKTPPLARSIRMKTPGSARARSPKSQPRFVTSIHVPRPDDLRMQSARKANDRGIYLGNASRIYTRGRSKQKHTPRKNFNTKFKKADSSVNLNGERPKVLSASERESQINSRSRVRAKDSSPSGTRPLSARPWKDEERPGLYGRTPEGTAPFRLAFRSKSPHELRIEAHKKSQDRGPYLGNLRYIAPRDLGAKIECARTLKSPVKPKSKRKEFRLHFKLPDASKGIDGKKTELISASDRRAITNDFSEGGDDLDSDDDSCFSSIRSKDGPNQSPDKLDLGSFGRKVKNTNGSGSLKVKRKGSGGRGSVGGGGSFFLTSQLTSRLETGSLSHNQKESNNYKARRAAWS
ncbi:hypothetical protein AAMO2058_001049700 [Amorphochlora amoebiformis]